PRAARLRQPVVGNLTRQRVLEHVLDLTLERRARAPADEVTALKSAQVRFEAARQLIDRAGPERAADHRGRLKRRLVRFGEQVETGGEHSLDRVRDVEV